MELRDDAVMRADDLRHLVKIAVQEFDHVCGTRALGHRGEPGNVGEEHSRLAFDRGDAPA